MIELILIRFTVFYDTNIVLLCSEAVSNPVKASLLAKVEEEAKRKEEEAKRKAQPVKVTLGHRKVGKSKKKIVLSQELTRKLKRQLREKKER